MKHALFVDIPHTNNPYVIKLMDSSIYATDLPIDCERLDVYFPGFEVPKYITVTSGFSVNLNAVDLKLQLVGDENMIRLPDGLYRIKYSVSPNEQVYVEYYHLRVTEMMNDYYKVLSTLIVTDCENTAKLLELRNIKLFIEGAKAQAEIVHADSLSVAMLDYASNRLRKFKSKHI